jgi:uncharacterized iron-regulated membrane protein
MTKILNKWLRRFHRWLALPFIALLLIVIFSRGTAAGDIAQRVQAPLMIIMALSGAYLWLLPYLTKWQRNRRRAG